MFGVGRDLCGSSSPAPREGEIVSFNIGLPMALGASSAGTSLGLVWPGSSAAVVPLLLRHLRPPLRFSLRSRAKVEFP